MLPGKWRPFFLGLNVLNTESLLYMSQNYIEFCINMKPSFSVPIMHHGIFLALCGGRPGWGLLNPLSPFINLFPFFIIIEQYLPVKYDRDLVDLIDILQKRKAPERRN